MYLLNRKPKMLYLIHIKFTFHYVSIKSQKKGEISDALIEFTFHYVSIKSYYIHYSFWKEFIYIPLCIY